VNRDACVLEHSFNLVIYIRLLCFAVTEQLDMNIKSKKNIKHIYNNVKFEASTVV